MTNPKRRDLARDRTSLHTKIAQLQTEYFSEDQNPVVAWEAIKRITEHNKSSAIEEGAPYPFPEWVNDYLMRSAEKIWRLRAGIKPDDDRPIDFNFDGWGALMSTPDGTKDDKRASHVPAVLGFTSSTFHLYDRMSQDNHNAKALDGVGAQLPKKEARKLQHKMKDIMATKNHVSRPRLENRLSEARGRMGTGKRS